MKTGYSAHRQPNRTVSYVCMWLTALGEFPPSLLPGPEKGSDF